MVTVSIVPATLEHAEYVAKHIRFADREEIWASHKYTPERALITAIMHSQIAFAGKVNGEVVCVWGIHEESLMLSNATPWMIGTDKLDKYAKTFIQHCRPQAALLLSQYKYLKNYVDARNTRAIRWLKWLGFRIASEPEPYGVMKLPFYAFTMRNK